jgi:CRISPR-associated protein Cas2
MPMTVVVTRDVAARYRGFMASVMPEIAPGVYIAAELSKGVRERIWRVAQDWWGTMPGGAFVMAWKDTSAAGGLAMQFLGVPPVDLADLDGVLVVRRRKPAAKEDGMRSESQRAESAQGPNKT